MESYRKFIDYKKLYYLRAKRSFIEQIEKDAVNKDDQSNFIAKNKQAFDIVFESLNEQLKKEDKAVEKMRMREYYHNGRKMRMVFPNIVEETD
jgi:hypothetical protein